MSHPTLPVLLVLFCSTLTLVVWAALKIAAPSPADRMRLSLAALLSLSGVTLVGVTPLATPLALVLQLVGLTIAARTAGLIPARRRRSAGSISVEDFRRLA